MEPQQKERPYLETQMWKPSLEKLEKVKMFLPKTWNEEIADLFTYKTLKPLEKNKLKPGENMRLKPVGNIELKPVENMELKPVPIGNGTIGIKPLVEKAPRLYSIWDISQKFLFLVNNIIIANPRNSNAPGAVVEILPSNTTSVVPDFSLSSQYIALAMTELYMMTGRKRITGVAGYISEEETGKTTFEYFLPGKTLRNSWGYHKSTGILKLFMEVFPNTALDPQRQPIFMGPNGRKYSLSCMKSAGGQPQLQLTEADIKKLYEKNQNALSFTFYSKTDGGPETCSFESAAFPGWFLSTSSQANKPMGLSRQGGAQNILFYFERQQNGFSLA